MSRQFLEAAWGTKIWRSSAILLLALLAGCATSDVSPLTCATDEDCPADKYCETSTSRCVDAREPTMDVGFLQDTGGDGTSPVQDSGDDPRETGSQPIDGGADVTPDVERTCSPACGDDEICDDGQCVSACDPACTPPEICTADGCVLPACSEAFAPCNLDEPDQGDFFCAQNENGEGVCLQKCDRALTAEGCPTSQYCWPLGTANDPADACIASSCTTHTDCPTGSCFRFDNDFGLCFSAGNTPIGGDCDVDQNQCEPGAACRPTGGSSGVCSRICDPWAADPGCAADEHCAYPMTNRSFLCTNDADPSGTQPYYLCDNPGAACGDATECFDVGSANACFKYCRPEADDCSGVNPRNNMTHCNNYIFQGERALGLCTIPCDPADPNPCGSGAVCYNGICRRTCTPGNETVDCCAGQTPCYEVCDPDTNLCE